MKSSESLLSAKLQLLLQRNSHLPTSNYLVSIHMKLMDGSLTGKAVMRVLKPVNSSHVEFDVTDLLRPLIAIGERQRENLAGVPKSVLTISMISPARHSSSLFLKIG